MKTIGILTFARVANFGANLQGLSTYYYLINNGFDPIFIDWEPIDFSIRQEEESKTIQGKAHFAFFDRYCRKTRKCRDNRDIIDVINENNIEGIIIGSDAVLQHHPFITRIKFPTKHFFYIKKVDSARLFPNPFWGTFIQDLKIKIPVVVISASSQNSPYKWFSTKIKKEMKSAIQSFSFISVRDNWTKDMIENITNKSISPCITPDPVFAFNYNCSNLIPQKEEILKKFNLQENYILVSFLNNNVVPLSWLENFKRLASNEGYELVALPMPNGICFEHNFNVEIKSPLSPIDWYSLIKYSKGYIGQNMHPIVVALHNAVPVYSFDSYGITSFFGLLNIKSSSKIYHILKEFNCQKNRTTTNTRFYKLPKVSSVLQSIKSSDMNELLSISNSKYSEYNAMMKKIISFI